MLSQVIYLLADESITEERMTYEILKKYAREKKTKMLVLRLTPTVFTKLQERSISQRRRPGELARVLVEEGLERYMIK